jgi:acyl-CoA thioesterase-2
MSEALQHLVRLLSLERLEDNLFRGHSENLGWWRVFGGQVLGQALSAAAQTVPVERRAHSLHAYFLRPGDISQPILYEVDRIRDGGSFTTRRVVAIQRGESIFHLDASFQLPEEGFEHALPMAAAPEPLALPTEQERNAGFVERARTLLGERAFVPGPFEVRTGDSDPAQPARRFIWIRATGPLPDDDALHRYLFAYASDYAFAGTALIPHGVTWLTPGVHLASLDHAVWFHRPFRVDDWLLHVVDSPVAAGARALVRGSVFTRDGALVASTAQEALTRFRSTDSAHPPATPGNGVMRAS